MNQLYLKKKEVCGYSAPMKALCFFTFLMLATTLLIRPVLGQSIVWTKVDSKVARPGETVDFDIELQNTKWTAGDTYILRSDGLPQGWISRFYYQGEEITAITVKYEERTIFQMEFQTTKTTDVGEYSFSFKAVGRDIGELPLTILLVQPIQEIESYSSVLSRVASPGDRLTLPFTVSNVGEESEEVEFSVLKPEGWSTRILDQTGEVTKIYLSTGSSLNLQLEVTIPLTSTGNNNLSLTATGTTDSTLNFTVTVSPLKEPIISCQLSGKSTTLGDPVKYQVKLKNYFGVEMQYILAVDSIPLDWTAYVKSAGDEIVTEVTLDGYESLDIYVEVTPPVTVNTGEYSVVVKAESSEGKVTTSLPLKIIVIETGEEEIQVAATFLEVTAAAGKVVRYPITVINSGETDRTLLLSVLEYPTGWMVDFKSNDIRVSGLYLAAGESENLVVEVTLPSTATIGNYAVPVQVKSEDATINIQLDLKATITGSYLLSLDPSTLYTNTVVGGSTTFTATIRNTGQTPVTGLRLDVEVPDGWEASVTPVQVESVQPRESTKFTIVANTPGDTVSGDYLLILKGLSDQIESDEVQVRVTTTTETSWGLIVLGLAGVAIVALIIVFKKFRRR